MGLSGGVLIFVLQILHVYGIFHPLPFHQKSLNMGPIFSKYPIYLNNHPSPETGTLRTMYNLPFHFQWSCTNPHLHKEGSKFYINGVKNCEPLPFRQQKIYNPHHQTNAPYPLKKLKFYQNQSFRIK